MVILQPVPHTISIQMADDEHFKDVKMWEIQTPPENSSVWAILMSYIFSPSSSLDRQERYQQLLLVLKKNNEQYQYPDGLEQKLENVSKKLFKFNPFRNSRFSFYKDSLIAALFNYFSEILYKRLGNNDDTFELQAVSNTLSCCIHMYEIESDEKMMYSFYHPEDELVNESGSFRQLILFKRPDPSMLTYGFGLSSSYASKLRISTLRFVAKETKMSNDVLSQLENVISDEKYDDNFLSGVLKTCKDAIHDLYKSLHVAQKLSEYGFNVDPKKTDSRGLSSFYYCISMHDIFALRRLYNYATNSIATPENCFRNPNENILTAVKEVRDTLENDLKISTGFSRLGDKREQARYLCESYLRFNEYQFNIVREILHIRMETSDKNLQQLKIIISIIDNYCEYFDKGSQENAFLNYVKFSAYYDNLDESTCFMFFDNLVSLYHFVDEKNKHKYVNAIQSLFLYTLSNRYVSEEQFYFVPRSFEELCKNPESIYRFMSFTFRTEFKENAMILLADLKETFTNNQLTKKFVKEMDLLRETITNLPEINNEFFARKLQNYFTIVTKNNSEINILCLERIIQVLGEIMCASNASGCIFKHFLQSCLPEGLEKSLCELRNHCFSHYRENAAQGRINLEKQRRTRLADLFGEIRDLFLILKPTTENYFLRLDELLIKRSKEKSRKGYIEIFQHFRRFQEHTLLHREKYFIENKKDFAIISNNLLQFIYERLSISELKKMSESLKLKSEDFLTLNKLDTYFRSLIYITEYISESNRNSDPHLINCCKSLNTAIDILGTKPIFEVRNKIFDILSDFKQIYRKVFDEFDKLNRYDHSIITLLKNLTKRLKNFNIFSTTESNQLIQHISDLLFESNGKFKEARNILKALSTIEDSHMTEEELEDLLKNVILPHKTRKKVFEHILQSGFKSASQSGFKSASQSGFKSASTCLEFEPVLKIKDIKDNLKLNVTKELMELFKEEKYRTIFLKMDLEPEIKRKVYYIMNQKIYFLIDRVKKFERILINSQENVRYLWLKSDTEAMKQHIKILMCERFLNEGETRVSLEMLLFDCLNILKDKELQELWGKNINMFNGINLRDFLSHGSPVVELVVNFLEPEDLPMTFIQKILELISDKEVLISLSQLWISVKPCTLQELEAILESDAEDDYSNSRKSIKSCPRWKNYFKLLPLEI